ncbi:MAG: ABC transporter ATP-binding protein [Elusimicrobiota bacterium]
MSAPGRLLRRVRPHRLRFYQAAVAMIVVAAANGLTVLLIKIVVNGLFAGKDISNSMWGEAIINILERFMEFTASTQTLAILTVSVPLLIGVKSIAAYIQNYLMSWLGQRVTQEMREELFRHLHTLSLDFYSENKSGEVLARVTNDLTLVQSMLQFVPLYLIRDLLTVIVLMGVLFFLNWHFALVALGMIPIAAVLIVILGRKMRDASSQSQAIMGHIYHRFQESLYGMTLIKAFNYEEGAIDKFRGENASFFSQMMRYLRATALSGPLMEFFGSLILALLLYFGGREILLGRMDAGDFAAFLTAFFSAYAPTKNLGKLNSELQRGLASADRIFYILDVKPSVVDRPGATAFTELREEIRLQGLRFKYTSRELPALDDIDLTFRRGETVAIVGPSGSGKSTIVHMLLRLYDPDEGAVLFDGRDLRDFRIRSVRKQIGLVTQETVLFNDDVRANIVIGRTEATADDIVRAAKIADAHDFILALPQGYDTILGDRGTRLSGGQRQRLAIARAVLTNPPLLVLDEATSNLDSTSESEVQKALENLMQGRTVILIAHRLSTVHAADRIYALNNGKVAETGTHAELLRRDGLYRRLYELQQTEPEEKPA